MAVKDGYECLELFEDGNTKNIVLILMDLRMRGLSGIDTVQELSLRNIDIPVIAVSAFLDEELEKSSAKSRFTESVQKPINITELNSKIKAIFD
ncbi:MAG TPA: response regulator [Spirochaetota bacterium]|nr:response regulator [Spirochaetota bacterium]